MVLYKHNYLSLTRLYLVRRVLVSTILYTPHHVFVTVCHCSNARQSHALVQVRQEAPEDVSGTLFSGDGKSIHPRTTHEHRLCAQAQCLDNIYACSDSTVKKDGTATSNGFDNLWQHVQASHCAVELPPSMVANHNPICPAFNSPNCIVWVLDAFQHYWPLPMLPNHL